MSNQTQVDVLRTATDLQAHFIRQLNATPDLDLILAEIAERAGKTLEADACTIFTIDPGGRRATQRAGTGYQKQFNGLGDVPVVPAEEAKELPDEGEKLGLTGWILSTGKPFLARSPEELVRHPHYTGRPQLPGEAIRLRSFLGVPIRGLHGEIIGVVKAERRLADSETGTGGADGAFSVDDELALATISRVAGRSIAYLEMVRRGKVADALTTWARDVISEAAASEVELDSFLDIVARTTAGAMDADSCGIFLIDESGKNKTLTERAGTGSQALRLVIRSYPWPTPEIIQDCKDVSHCIPPRCLKWRQRDPEERAGLTAWIAATGKSFHARNYAELSHHCHHRGHYDPQNFGQDEECGAFLGVPLQVGGTIIGVVKVENIRKKGQRDDRDFSIEARRRFDILAQDIALAIKSLQAQLPARQRIIRKAEDTIFDILKGGLEIPVLVNKVVEETRALFNAGACALFLKEGDRLVQRPWAASGYPRKGPEERYYDLCSPELLKDDPRPEERKGLTVWIAVKRQKFTARSFTELAMHPHHLGRFDKYNFEKGGRCHSLMGFPLLVREGDKEELIGVLKVESKMRDVDGVTEYTYFTDLDELAFELIANSAALAIHNARLVRAGREADREVAEGKAREQAWKEFSAMSAHRIGTEAARMGGALRWLEEGTQKGQRLQEVKQHLTRIGDALGHLDVFVHEFSEFATPPELKPEPLNLGALFRELESNFEGDFERWQINFRKDLPVDLPQILGDRTRLLYAFTEMIQNAVKAMPSGGDLTLSAKPIGGGEKIRVDFVDTGAGVRLEIKDKIFEPGFKDRPGGTGLGLAIVRQTVAEHLGMIEEIGTPGTGAHFVIILPRGSKDGTVVGEPVKPPAGAVRILIVDDGEDFRFDLEQFVKKDGPDRRVFLARNELEAGRIIAAEPPFDVVITDIKLEDAGGSATGGLRVLQAAREKNRATPVIVVSAFGKMPLQADEGPSPSVMSVEDMARHLGCFDFVIRDAGHYLEVVREAVNRALSRRRSGIEVSAD